MGALGPIQAHPQTRTRHSNDFAMWNLQEIVEDNQQISFVAPKVLSIVCLGVKSRRIQSELTDKYLDDEEFTAERFKLAAKDYGNSRQCS
jgi:hypothetical protein